MPADLAIRSTVDRRDQYQAIVEHLDGGEDEEEVAEQFDLSLDDVRWAPSYELSRRTPAAA